MNNQYLIPANSKKSQLIFNVFRLIDLIILITGACITLILMFVFKGDSLTELAIKLAPVGIALFLVMPIPFYHNVLVFMQEMYTYYANPTQYYWRGWCATYVDDDAGQQQTQSRR